LGESHSWEDIIKVDLEEMRYWNMDEINLAESVVQWRILVNEVTNILCP
jgi:hypothetical protein